MPSEYLGCVLNVCNVIGGMNQTRTAPLRAQRRGSMNKPLQFRKRVNAIRRSSVFHKFLYLKPVFTSAILAFLCQSVFGNKPTFCAFCYIFPHFCIIILQNHVKTQIQEILTGFFSAQQQTLVKIYNSLATLMYLIQLQDGTNNVSSFMICMETQPGSPEVPSDPIDCCILRQANPVWISLKLVWSVNPVFQNSSN